MGEIVAWMLVCMFLLVLGLLVGGLWWLIDMAHRQDNSDLDKLADIKDWDHL